MIAQKSLTNTAFGLKTLCTLLVLMFLAGIVQMIAVQLYLDFSRDYFEPVKKIVQLTEEQWRQQEIDNARKEFSLEGEIYLATYNVVSPGRLDETKMIVKDPHGEVLFTGKEEDNPYTFIQWYPKDKKIYSKNSNQQNLNELNMLGGEFSVPLSSRWLI